MASSSNHTILGRCPQISSFTPPDWSTLPPDLLQSIASALQSLADYIRFRSVCRSWNAAVEIIPRELPWLMLPFTSSSDKQHRGFFNPFTNTHHRLFLPEVSPDHRIVGSSPSGYWVITDGSPELIAINPLTRKKFPLPPLTSFPIVGAYNLSFSGERYTVKPLESISLKEMRDRFIRKVILTRDSQDPSKFFAFAMPAFCSDFAYCKQGDTLWRGVSGTRTYDGDAICFRGKLYLVDKCGSLAICEFSHHQDSLTVLEFIKFEQVKVVPPYCYEDHYLVDATDELLRVKRRILGKKVVAFDVFKFDWIAKEWRVMSSLENRILFLSQQYSFAVSSIAYSGWGKESIVCFTRDWKYFHGKTDSCEGDFGAVIYRMAGGMIEEEVAFCSEFLLYPIWFAPSLC